MTAKIKNKITDASNTLKTGFSHLEILMRILSGPNVSTLKKKLNKLVQ